jgi:lipopolysaccharide export system permease protein
MWLASAILLPLGVFITIKATNDSGLLDSSAYTNFFTLFFKKKNKKQ